MVQYKKDEIKEKIDLAALTVFAEKGYSKAKISDIAENAGISVGNIYRYYKSKEEIFYFILPESFLILVKSLLIEKISIIKDKNIEIYKELDKMWVLNDEFILFMIENKERILILFNNSQGTKYENSRYEIIEFIIKSVKDIYKINNKFLIDENKFDFILKGIYENVINMTLNVLKVSNDTKEVKEYIKTVNSYHMFGITSLFRG